MRFTLLALVLCTFSCTRTRSPSKLSALPAASSNASTAQASASGSEEGSDTDEVTTDAAVPPISTGPWRDSVRAGRWREAAERLDALSESEKKRPEMRFLRARIAIALHDFTMVVRLISDLEKELPVVAHTIARWRAEAQMDAGPFEEAALWFGTQRGVRALTQSAYAYERAGRIQEARNAVDRAVQAGKGGIDEAEARALRGRLAEAAGAKEIALSDFRWIANEAPASSHDMQALEGLVRLDPEHPLSARDRVARAEKLATAGRVDETMRELEAAQSANDPLPKGELLHRRGNILYKLRKWREASEILHQAMSEGSPSPAEDEFYAARALSRANRDEEAIAAYHAFISKNPSNSLADDALYLAARLGMLLGKWKEASDGYTAYLKKYPNGKNHNDASYELALVELASNKPEKARALFSTLASSTESKPESARFHELEGVCAFKAGNPQEATRIFTEVIHAQPLSWSALVAKARLEQIKATIPPWIEPANEVVAPSPLDIKFPSPVEFFYELGLLAEAEATLAKGEKMVATQFAPRSTEALCQGYARLERAGRRYRLAQESIRAETLLHAPNATTRWAWDCLYPTPYVDTIRASEVRDNLPPGLLYAVMRQESAFAPEVVSPAGAIGLLQLMPETARSIAKEASVSLETTDALKQSAVNDALKQSSVNIDLGSRYLARLMRMWHGNIPLAIASYNAGPHAVSRWIAQAEGMEVDLWVARIPYAETRNYVGHVLGNLAHYAYLSGNEALMPVISLTITPGMRIEEGAF